VPRPVFGLLGEPLKIQQVYYCVGTLPKCKLFKKPVLSWLTPEESKRLVNPQGQICPACKRPLKWVRSEPYFPNRTPHEG
jgi:hypothetical protein